MCLPGRDATRLQPLQRIRVSGRYIGGVVEELEVGWVGAGSSQPSSPGGTGTTVGGSPMP